MHADEVRLGETYRVRVTHEDNPAQYATGNVEFMTIFAFSMESAIEFDFTVTATGETLSGEPAVTGIRVSESSRVSTPLPPEIAERLALPPDGDYVVEGVLKDAKTGQIVTLPTDHTLTIPAAWLS
ncbi:hypothetical protein SAMN05421504_103455 [Amycolatopsis xylanica]|uniref:Uncharacterized protein n=1 Tax=Amycolatopsis xylanica TaxID=589385 RepID=A0A1H3DN77_9PSEU|nr:hypothetical protein [Amycolatopsis xylanica]SDX67807.1 hypothetical protein SAMN05421504_103455 [Amycolatopsis xylanica]